MKTDIRNYKQLKHTIMIKDYLHPEIVELDLDIQQVLCMSTEDFTINEEEYEGFQTRAMFNNQTESENEKEHMSPDNSCRSVPGMLYYPVESRRNDATIVNDADCGIGHYNEILLYMNAYDTVNTVVFNAE